MEYAEYLDRFRAHARLATVEEYASVHEQGLDYPLLRVTTPGERVCTITAGFHGEEPAGPLTLLEHLPEVLEHARMRNVGLRIYPNLNPSGFEVGTRYNKSGEQPNNDFLRYEIAPGVWVGELQPGQAFLRWELFQQGPKETRALRSDLQAQPAPHAALDIHQDRYIEGALTYAYVFGPASAYEPLIERSSEHLSVARDLQVDTHHRTDPAGLIVAHDGSITDYFWRRGVPYCAALETTTHTPMAACHRVNLVWIHGFIELAARV
jgi:predicted deacylase